MKYIKPFQSDIIAYHGSNSNIKSFTIDYVGGEKAVDAIGPGIYFTSNKEESELYGKYTYTVKLNPRKFLTDEKKKNFPLYDAIKLVKMKKDWQYNAQDWHENPEIGLRKFLNEIFKEDNDKDIILYIWGDFYRYDSKNYVKNASLLGIDGLKIINHWGGGGSSINYIIYNPDIIQIVNQEINSIS
jgi:hypothetical protein